MITLNINKYNIIQNLKLKTKIMIYFFNSSRKDDKLTHPVTISTNSERRAYALAVINFKKHHLIDSPKLIQL